MTRSRSVKAIIDQSIVVFKDQQMSAPDREKKLRGIAESHFDFAEMSKSTSDIIGKL